jgi:hypothetical protein
MINFYRCAEEPQLYLQKTQQELTAGKGYATKALIEVTTRRIAVLCEQLGLLETQLATSGGDLMDLCA